MTLTQKTRDEILKLISNHKITDSNAILEIIYEYEMRLRKGKIYNVSSDSSSSNDYLQESNNEDLPDDGSIDENLLLSIIKKHKFDNIKNTSSAQKKFESDIILSCEKLNSKNNNETNPNIMSPVRDRERRGSIYSSSTICRLVFLPKSDSEFQFLSNALSQNILCRLLNPRQRRQVINVMKPVDFPANKVIIEEGEMGEEMYIVGYGELAIYKKSDKIDESYDKNENKNLDNEENEKFKDKIKPKVLKKKYDLKNKSDCSGNIEECDDNHCNKGIKIAENSNPFSTGFMKKNVENEANYNRKSSDSFPYKIIKKRGDLVGELAILHYITRTANVKTLTDVMLWVITQQEYYTITTGTRMWQMEVIEKCLSTHVYFSLLRKKIIDFHKKNKPEEHDTILNENHESKIYSEEFNKIDSRSLNEQNYNFTKQKYENVQENESEANFDTNLKNLKDDISCTVIEDGKDPVCKPRRSGNIASFQDREIVLKYVKKVSSHLTYNYHMKNDIIRPFSTFIVVSRGKIKRVSDQIEFAVMDGIVLCGEYECETDLEGFYVEENIVKGEIEDKLKYS